MVKTAYLIQWTAGRSEQCVRLENQQLQQFILDFGQLGRFVAQDRYLQRHDRSQLAEYVADRHERIVRDGIEREGLPVFDRDGTYKMVEIKDLL